MRTPHQAHEQTLPHPCSTCAATPGQRCTQGNGYPAQWPHSPRLALVDGDVAWPAMSRAQYERHAPPPRTGPPMTCPGLNHCTDDTCSLTDCALYALSPGSLTTERPDPGQRYRLTPEAARAVTLVTMGGRAWTQPYLRLLDDGVTLDLWPPPATTTPTTEP